MSLGVVVEYHEHLPVSHIPEDSDKPVWGCKYVYLDGVKCDSTNGTPGYPTGWAGNRTMTREAVDAHRAA